MLFMATGRLRSEQLKSAGGVRRPPPGVLRLAEYVVPGSGRFFGIYQAENLSSLSQLLAERPYLELDAVQPILHLDNLRILAETPPPPEPPGEDVSF